ncbi:MAG: hypothetical protein C4522_12420 [Desulfobacteraceae bacterium]|nr:MAG: hypothetical protein C4522_12420 [Desulfobacteraceae bacterium]
MFYAKKSGYLSFAKRSLAFHPVLRPVMIFRQNFHFLNRLFPEICPLFFNREKFRTDFFNTGTTCKFR